MPQPAVRLRALVGRRTAGYAVPSRCLHTTTSPQRPAFEGALRLLEVDVEDQLWLWYLG